MTLRLVDPRGSLPNTAHAHNMIFGSPQNHLLSLIASHQLLCRAEIGSLLLVVQLKRLCGVVTTLRLVDAQGSLSSLIYETITKYTSHQKQWSLSLLSSHQILGHSHQTGAQQSCTLIPHIWHLGVEWCLWGWHYRSQKKLAKPGPCTQHNICHHLEPIVVHHCITAPTHLPCGKELTWPTALASTKRANWFWLF